MKEFQKKKKFEKINRNLVNNKIISKKNFFNCWKLIISKDTLKILKKNLNFQIPDTALVGK